MLTNSGRPHRLPEHAGVRITAMRPAIRLRPAILLAVLALPGLGSAQIGSKEAAVSVRARQLHDRAIVIDSHADTPQRMLFDKTFDLGVRHKDGSIDIPRMREGGLDAVFFSIWVPSDVSGPPGVKRALDLIDAVREAVRRHQ